MAKREAGPSSDRRGADIDSPIIPGVRRLAPGELESAEVKVWNEIVGELPPDWFTGDNAPLLKELCRHIAYADELAAEMKSVKVKIAALRLEPGPVAAKTKAVDQQRKVLHSLLRLHGYQSERIGNLATKLRMTNQSRYQAQKANDQHARASSGPKPWENWQHSAAHNRPQ